MSRRRVSVRHRFSRGRASDYIQSWDSLCPGDKVIICCRVSNCDQNRKSERNSRLRDQEVFLRRRLCEISNIEVVRVLQYVGSGCNPFWLARAIHVASQHNAKLVAESTNRFIRSPYYHSNDWPEAQARPSELEDLREATNNL